MDLQRILNLPSEAPSEVPHTYPGTPVQATQSSQSTQPIGGSPPSTPTRRNLETSRDLRLVEAVPDSYIQSLYDSWWRRRQAVIDANGGPTKY
jgi:hypothetical protein